MKSKNIGYLPRLDHLRFFAAFLVAAFHFHGNQMIPADTHNPLLILVREGECGVSLFMVLSGFILANISIGKEIDYRHFIFNRILRIYPLYLTVVMLTAAAGRHLDVLSIVATLLPIGAVGGVTLSHISHLWTIAVEFQFYLVFPFLIAFLNRYGVRYLFGIIAFTLGIRLLEFYYDGTVMDASYFTILGRMDQFVVGMLVAVAYKRFPHILRSPATLLVSMALVVGWFSVFTRWTGGGWTGQGSDKSLAWVVSPTVEALAWGGLILTYLSQSWRLPQTVDQVLAFLGTISFSMYVWQSPIDYVFSTHPQFQPFSHWWMDFGLIVMPIILAASTLSFYVIERPFFSYRTRYVSDFVNAAESVDRFDVRDVSDHQPTIGASVTGR